MIQVIDFIGGEYENRTHVHGFAIRCVTTLFPAHAGMNRVDAWNGLDTSPVPRTRGDEPPPRPPKK